MKLATLFSGIGAPEVAAKSIGWECLWSAEIEPFPSAVLAHHHPESINLGDVTAPDFRERMLEHEKPEILVFGTPCQSFSVAGRRAGLDDPRGVLAFVALGIVDALRPPWFVFENVPGMLSSGQGRDFEAFLRAVHGCGYSGAWASPDAQWFGVPQRRKRIFFVGHSGDWRYPAAVLSQFTRLSGHSPPRREAGEGTARSVAPGLTGSGRGVERVGESRGQDPVITHTVTAEWAKGSGGPAGDECQTSEYHVAVAFQDAQIGCRSAVESSLIASTLGAGADKQNRMETNGGFIVCHNPVIVCSLTGNPYGDYVRTASMYLSGGATAGNNPGARNCFPHGMGVRRLMPIECESLMGFPPSYTSVTYKGKPAADGPRYRALGNSMAVPVIQWILERIQAVEKQGETRRGDGRPRT